MSTVARKRTALSSPQAVANYFLSKAKKERIPLSPMKLIKLVYIAHGWILATFDVPLFSEPVEAWQHGPVVPSLYHEFKGYGSGPISREALELDPDGTVFSPTLPVKDERILSVLDKMWQVYKHMSAGQLRLLTHREDTPWSRTFKQDSRGAVIHNQIIKDHYLRLIPEITSNNFTR